MRRLHVVLFTLAAGLLAVLVQAGFFAGAGDAAAGPRVFSALGVAEVQGEQALVHITVLVPPGSNGREVANAALARSGARPIEPGA